MRMPAERLRPLFDAFAVQLRYNLNDNSIKIEATVSTEVVPTWPGWAAARVAATPSRPRQREIGQRWGWSAGRIPAFPLATAGATTETGPAAN